MERKAVSGTMLTLLVISMLTLAFNFQPAKSSPATDSGIFDDDFEEYNLGNLHGQGGWSGSSIFQVVNTLAHGGTKSAYSQAYDTFYGISKYGTKKQTGIQSIYIYFSDVRIGTSNAIFLYLRGDVELGGSFLNTYGFRYNNIASKWEFIYQNGSDPYNMIVLVDDVSKQTWHSIQAEFNEPNWKYRIKLDDGNWSNWLDFFDYLNPSLISGVEGFRILTYGAETWFDTIDGEITPSSIRASPTSLAILQGDSDTSIITITSIGGFDQPVQLTVSGTPSGVTTTLSPEQVTPPPDGTATSILTVSVDTTATPGSYTLTVTGTNGTITHSVSIHLEIATRSGVFDDDFETYNLGVLAGQGGWSGSGPGTYFVVNTRAQSGTQSAYINQGQGWAWIQKFGNLTSTGIESIYFYLGNRNINTNAFSQILRGYTQDAQSPLLNFVELYYNNSTSKWELKYQNGHDPYQMIFLYDNVSPNTWHAIQFQYSTLNKKYKIKLDNNGWSDWIDFYDYTPTLLGTWGLRIGAYGSEVWVDTIDGEITPPPPSPDFSITASPASLAIQQGSSDTSVITITSINGFNQPVQLTVSGAPSGVTATLNPEQVTPPSDGSTTSTLTVSVTITATPGSYTLTVTGTNGTLTHNINIPLEITAPPPNQPPDPPTFLLQYELDGPEIPVGGTISGDAVTLIGCMSDPEGDQVKLQIELRRLDEYDGNFIGVHTHESEFVESDYGAMINITGLILGYYHWQARTVDELGATSNWVSFPERFYPPNPESAADFTIRVHYPPYAQGDAYNHSDYLGYEWACLSKAVGQVNEATGEGTIGLTAAVTGKAIGGGTAWANAGFTLKNTWKSTLTGEYNMVASFKISGVMQVFKLATIIKPPGASDATGSLKARIDVYDKTGGTMILQKELVIFEQNSEWWEKIPIIGEIGGWLSGRLLASETYKNEQFAIEGLLHLEENHEYEWTFTMGMEGEAAAVLCDSAYAYGLIDAVLMETRLEREGDPERWIPPIDVPFEHIVTTNEYLHVNLGCPVAVMVVDPEGKRIGVDFDTMEEVNEIPGAWYSGLGTGPQFIRIPAPLAGNYSVLLLGTDLGTDLDAYTVIVAHSRTRENTTQEAIGFIASDIPTSVNAIHQYTVDWDALSRGEEGVTVQVDSDGDGVFEHTFTSDSELTRDEFLSAAVGGFVISLDKPALLIPWIFLAALVMVAAVSVAISSKKWSRKGFT